MWVQLPDRIVVWNEPQSAFLTTSVLGTVATTNDETIASICLPIHSCPRLLNVKARSECNYFNLTYSILPPVTPLYLMNLLMVTWAKFMRLTCDNCCVVVSATYLTNFVPRNIRRLPLKLWQAFELIILLVLVSHCPQISPIIYSIFRNRSQNKLHTSHNK